MLQVKPGDIIYSRRHRCLLYCDGRNGGRPHELTGQVIRRGLPDPAPSSPEPSFPPMPGVDMDEVPF